MEERRTYRQRGGKLTAKFDKDTLLDAVAFQDHYARAMKVSALPRVGTMFRKPTRNAPLPPVGLIEGEEHINRRSGRYRSNNVSRGGKKPVLDTMDYRQYMGCKADIAEKLFHLEKKKEQRKYVSKLSLAQKRGLVQKPNAPLTLDEWNNVFTKAKERVKLEQTCPICMDDFKLKAQVVLSCTHFFHKNCLESFEKFNDCRKCPICRAE